jgi:HEPN domain-containing protein
MIKKNDLESLAEIRLEDANILFQSGKHSSAYYLAGYAIELALKVCISKQMEAEAIPDRAFINSIYTHRLDSLLSLAGLRSVFESESRLNANLAANWAVVATWDEQSRYEFWDSLAASSLLSAINDPANGVFIWVKKHW